MNFESIDNLKLLKSNSSMLPSDLINVYLSGLNSKNTSPLPAEGLVLVVILLLTISTVYVFLIVMDELSKFKDEIFFFGTTANKESSID